MLRWISQIQMGCFQLEKKKSPGRPVSTVNAAKVQKVRQEAIVRRSMRHYQYTLKTCVHDVLTGIKVLTAAECFADSTQAAV